MSPAWGGSGAEAVAAALAFLSLALCLVALTGLKGGWDVDPLVCAVVAVALAVLHLAVLTERITRAIERGR